MKLYINLIFSLVTPLVKQGAWLGGLPELSALSQTIQLHAPTNMSGGRLDQKMPLHYNLIKLPCGKRLFPRGGPVSSRKNGVYRNQRPGQ